MRIHRLLPILALVAAPAFAQGFHWGLSAGITNPQGDVKDAGFDKIGLTLGLNVGVEFQGGHVLRPRLDIARASNKYDSNFTLNTTFLGADYNYFVSGKAADGFYLIAGLGFSNTKLEYDFGGGTASDNKSALGLALGMGYQFTPLVGADLRYTTTKPDFYGQTISNNAMNVSVTFRF